MSEIARNLAFFVSGAGLGVSVTIYLMYKHYKN